MNKTTIKMLAWGFAAATAALYLYNNSDTYADLVGGGGFFS